FLLLGRLLFRVLFADVRDRRRINLRARRENVGRQPVGRFVAAFAEAIGERLVDLTGDGDRRVLARVRPHADDGDGELRVFNRRVRSEQADPAALPDARAGLARDGFTWIVGALA